MGQVRVVLYAEGPRETSGGSSSSNGDSSVWGRRRTAGEIIPEEDQGPGHVLIKRILVEMLSLPEGAIQFEEGLKDNRGRVPRGSHFLRKSTLRRLLSWAHSDLIPHLAVVLVDRDGVAERRETLHAFVTDLRQTANVIAVAREEFEAWLVADENAAGQILESIIARTPDPERLEPKEAKTTIDQWTSSVPRQERPRARRDIAALCDLEILQSRCKAFGQLVSDLSEITF